MLDYVRIILAARLERMDQRGASAVEYGLLIAGIAAIIAVAVYAFGGGVNGLFSNTCKTFNGQSHSGSC
jgi:pilus assembly protein Flp/PilA